MKKILILASIVLIASCSTSQDRKKLFPIYGNYCGDSNPRASSKLDPIDTMDFLCQERLDCHRRNPDRIAACDRLMALEAKKLTPQDSQERALQRSIISYFESSDQ